VLMTVYITKYLRAHLEVRFKILVIITDTKINLMSSRMKICSNKFSAMM
jgi:hypothetical protein